MTCHEELNRLKRAIKLRDAIEATVEVRRLTDLISEHPLSLAKRMKGDSWEIMAQIAEIKEASLTTEAVTVQLLQDAADLKARLMREALVPK